MSLLTGFIIIVTVVVCITDAIVFSHVQKNPDIVTAPFVVLVIIVTVIPVSINLLYWLRAKQAR
jgi:hypothetical protein